MESKSKLGKFKNGYLPFKSIKNEKT